MRINLETKAFTLAEVLLVLSVIGVIAALTIPTLILKVSDDQYKIAWKKAYSAASQAWTKVIADNGGSAPGTLYAMDKIRWNAFKSQFNIIKDCTGGTSAGNCWAASGVTPDAVPGGWGGFQANHQITYNPSFMTADGASWMIYTDTAGTRFISYIAVDVNGPKSPNQWNKDVFTLALLDDRVGDPGGFLATGGNVSLSHLMN